MNKNIVVGVIYEAIDNIKNNKDWYYARGMIDMAWMSDIIEYKEVEQLRNETDKMLRKVSYEEEAI